MLISNESDEVFTPYGRRNTIVQISFCKIRVSRKRLNRLRAVERGLMDMWTTFRKKRFRLTHITTATTATARQCFDLLQIKREVHASSHPFLTGFYEDSGNQSQARGHIRKDAGNPGASTNLPIKTLHAIGRAQPTLMF